jgi:hypothetical protein
MPCRAWVGSITDRTATWSIQRMAIYVNVSTIVFLTVTTVAFRIRSCKPILQLVYSRQLEECFQISGICFWSQKRTHFDILMYFYDVATNEIYIFCSFISQCLGNTKEKRTVHVGFLQLTHWDTEKENMYTEEIREIWFIVITSQSRIVLFISQLYWDRLAK